MALGAKWWKIMNTVAYLAVSLDGYIADKDGEVDWLNEIPNPDQSDFGFADFMQSVDAMVMGANTFRYGNTSSRRSNTSLASGLDS